jgi:hypothetical protein
MHVLHFIVQNKSSMIYFYGLWSDSVFILLDAFIKNGDAFNILTCTEVEFMNVQFR